MENFTEFAEFTIQPTETFQSYINFIKNCFLFLGIGTAGLSISILIIANILFTNVSSEYKQLHGYDSDEDSEEDHEEDDEEEVLLENKYIDEYNNLEMRELEDDELILFKNQFIEDECPQNNGESTVTIQLAYDKDNTAFLYYSDSKDIPYKYLEAIARRYVVYYDCKKLLIDTATEYAKAIDLCKKEEEEEEEEEAKKIVQDTVEKSTSVFATFKKYTKESLTKTTVKKIPLMDETNRYIYKGTMIDFDKLLNTRSVIEEFEQLDYSTFKKLKTNDCEKKTL